MPLYVERANADYLTGQQIVEQLGAYLAGQYQAAEADLLVEIARRVALDMNADSPTRRVESVRRLRAAAEKAIAEIGSEEAARRVVATAMREGEAAAIEQLGFARAAAGGTTPALNREGTAALPFSTGLSQGSAIAAAQLGLELTSTLEQMNARILRAVSDVYQQTIARFAGQRLLGVTTGRQAQNRAVVDFLANGITGITYRDGKRMTMGAYAEMATRTATNRAWLGAHVARWAAADLHLVTIVRGVDSCPGCAAWSGRVLSTDGRTGTIEAEHATTGERVTIEITGTIEQARAGGWNHPNCRCTLAPVFAGLSLPANDSTYDPQQEKDRDRLRYLERRTRAFKLRGELSSAMGDDVSAASWRRRARAEQSRIREHVANTGQLRKPYRESASFSGVAPVPNTPPALLRG